MRRAHLGLEGGEKEKIIMPKFWLISCSHSSMFNWPKTYPGQTMITKTCSLAPKPVENIVAMQQYQPLVSSNILWKFLCVLQLSCGVEMALVRITNDLLVILDWGQMVTVAMLNLTAYSVLLETGCCFSSWGMFWGVATAANVICTGSESISGDGWLFIVPQESWNVAPFRVAICGPHCSVYGYSPWGMSWAAPVCWWYLTAHFLPCEHWFCFRGMLKWLHSMDVSCSIRLSWRQ